MFKYPKGQPREARWARVYNCLCFGHLWGLGFGAGGLGIRVSGLGLIGFGVGV